MTMKEKLLILLKLLCYLFVLNCLSEACSAQERQQIETAVDTVNTLQEKEAFLSAKLDALEGVVGRNHPLMDCKDWFDLGARKDGVYTITPVSGMSFQVFCIMERDGGGWTVLQRRYIGTLNFDRIWEDYKNGFGNKKGEHWAGLELAYRLSNVAQHELRIEVKKSDGTNGYAQYQQFLINSETDLYRFNVQNYVGGTLGDIAIQPCDSTGSLNGAQFSTRDRDNDQYSGSCAQTFLSGWWYKNCAYTHLNMAWATNWFQTYNCVSYNQFLRGSLIMIRRVNSNYGVVP